MKKEIPGQVKEAQSTLRFREVTVFPNQPYQQETRKSLGQKIDDLAWRGLKWYDAHSPWNLFGY